MTQPRAHWQLTGVTKVFLGSEIQDIDISEANLKIMPTGGSDMNTGVM